MNTTHNNSQQKWTQQLDFNAAHLPSCQSALRLASIWTTAFARRPPHVSRQLGQYELNINAFVSHFYCCFRVLGGLSGYLAAKCSTLFSSQLLTLKLFLLEAQMSFLAPLLIRPTVQMNQIKPRFLLIHSKKKKFSLKKTKQTKNQHNTFQLSLWSWLSSGLS